MPKYTVNYRGKFSLSIIAENEEEAAEKATKASFLKTLKGLHPNIIAIQKEFYEDEEDDCPECGSKLRYITPEVRHCKKCNYYEIDCPECGSNQFDGSCGYCKYKQAGYVSCDQLNG